MRDVVRRSPLASYFVLAYAFSWAYWIPMLVRGLEVRPGSLPTHFPGLLGPAAAACVVTVVCDGRAGLARLLRRLLQVSRPSPRFWAYSLSPVGFLALALVVMRIRGLTLPGPGEFASFSGLPLLGLPIVILLVFAVASSGEELGWRGFALERLQQRHGALGGAVVLALVWAGWHAPTFGIIQAYREMSPPMIVGGFLLGLTAGSLVLARVAQRTGGSVLAASLWHTAYNLTAATAAGGGFVAAFTTTCVMAWAAVLAVREWRRPALTSLLMVRPPA